MSETAEEARVLSTILKGMLGDLIVLDAQGEVVYATRGAEERFGNGVIKTLRGLRPDDLFTPESARQLLEVIQNVLKKGMWANLQADLVTSPGQTRTMSIAVAPYDSRRDRVVLIGQTSLVGLLAADLERREREKELACVYHVSQAIEQAGSEEEYLSMLPRLICQGCRFPNLTFVHILFKDQEYGQRVPEGAVRMSYPLVIEGSEEGSLTVWTTQDVSFLAEEEQMIQEVCRVTSKVIEKYAQELAHKRTLRRLQTLLHAIPDRIVLLDRDYSVLISNDPEGGAREHLCYRYYYEQARPCHDCPVAEVLNTGKSATRKWRHPHKILHLSAYPVLSSEGEVEGVVEYVKDITQEERVQEQLVQADKMASLGQLTAGVAHEINNPVQFIHENIRMFREALGDILPILREYQAQHSDLRVARLPFPFFQQQMPILVADVESGAIRIRDIVASLKQFAANNEGLLNEWVDLAEVIETSLRLTHNQVKNTAFVMRNIQPDLPKIRGNSQKIEQVLVNIIINAIQAIREERSQPGVQPKSPVITLSARYEPNTRLIHLDIGDNGPGIPPENLRRVFDPFFTTKQQSGGTGLGLSIAYGIIQEHQGSITVDSRIGQDTTFHIRLPASAEESDAKQHPADRR